MKRGAFPVRCRRRCAWRTSLSFAAAWGLASTASAQGVAGAVQAVATPAALACLSPPPGDRGVPGHPPELLEVKVGGDVKVVSRLNAPDAAPAVEVQMPAPHRRIAAPPADAPGKAEGFRVPCHADAPVSAVRSSGDRIIGSESGAVLEDMDLLALLRSVRDIDDTPVRFDLARPGCPFDLRVQHLQPFAPNAVGQVGPPQPARQPPMERLATLVLDIPETRPANASHGEAFTLGVPGGRIAL